MKNKVGTETLDEVKIFEKPKYAFVFHKGDNHYVTYEIWGIGKIKEYDTIPETRSDNMDKKNWATSNWYRLLYFECGVLWALEEDDVILLIEPPSKQKITEMLDFIANGNDANCFTTNKYCGDIG